MGYASKFPRTEPKKEQRPWAVQPAVRWESDARTAVNDGDGEVKQSVAAEINT